MLTAFSILLGMMGYMTDYSNNVATTEEIQEIYCLARNIYFESFGESYIGKIAVAEVTMNRVIDDRYPDTICDVVKEWRVNPKTKKIYYMFSWVPYKSKVELYKNGQLDILSLQAWIDSVGIAINIVAGIPQREVVPTATHFYAHNIVPNSWVSTLCKVKKIGNHTFMDENCRSLK